MSLEEALKENTAAVLALTAAMKSGGGASTGSSKPAADAGKTATEYKAKHSVEEMQAVMTKYKDKAGMEKAKAIINDIGKVKTMKEVTDPKAVDAVYEAAEKALKALEEEM